MANQPSELETYNASRLFSGHRALGLVSNHIPLVTRYVARRKETLIVTVIGNSFLTYGSRKLGLLSAGTAHEDDITCLAADTYHVYTASGTTIKAWRRGTELKHEYKGHLKPIHIMLSFGPHLLAVDETNILKVWDIKAEEVILELNFNSNNFTISSLMHPATYLNKILVGSTQGSLQLWNLKSAKQVYAYNGWGSCVTVLEQAPAIDVVAVGLASGDIILHNIKFDQSIVKFRQEWGPITALTFRTDGAPIMITGSTQGHLAIWDLEQQILLHQHRHAHRGSITGLKSLPSEPLIVTSSRDNALKMWIFDQSDGGMRLLHLKEGHKAPPTRLRFHDLLGEWILSAGLDSSMRSFSTVADILHRNLGTAHKNQKKAKRLGSQKGNKLSPITDFSSEPIRDKEWDSIAAVHRGCAAVTCWSFNKSTMGEHKLIHPRFKDSFDLYKASATCVCVTACGNFAVIGYDSGHIDRFNMQSGLHRATYSLPQDKLPKPHLPFSSNPVRGVASHMLSQVIGAFANGILMFWNFQTCEIIEETNLKASPSFIRIHPESGLLAIGLEDFVILIVEIETRKIIRRLCGHSARLTDATFSPNGHWLVSSSQDASVRTWDLPSGKCVDHFLVPKACVSLTFSANGGFLASAHVDDLGIYLWNNQSLFTQVSLRALENDFEPKLAPLPGTAPRRSDEETGIDVTTNDAEDEFSSPEQIAHSLVTLSLLPESRWKNLLSLDAIKRRNKPKDPPKVKQQAPFFLSNLTGVKSTGDAVKNQESRVLESGSISFDLPSTAWAKKLLAATSREEYVNIVEDLKLMGPSAIDTEIRCLGPHAGGSTQLLGQFLRAAAAVLETRRNYEVIHAYLGLFLKIHCGSLSEDTELCSLAKSISADRKSVV